MKPSLLIMAAGMGSRYGGLKQIDSVSPNEEAIIEYSVYDAIRYGFDEIVFIIRKDIQEEFEKNIVNKISSPIKISFVFQDTKDLPAGFTAPENREKPWGTAHAVWSARKKLNKPFLVINADDFYGKDSFAIGGEFLSKSGIHSTDYGLIAYQLKNTLSDFGGVTRAVCKIKKDGFLQDIRETTGIQRVNNNIECQTEDNNDRISGDTLVSMNMWAFTPAIFEQLEKSFIHFLEENIEEPTSEFLIPSVIYELIINKNARVMVLHSDEQWIGMTFREDKRKVRQNLGKLIRAGTYPEKLW